MLSILVNYLVIIIYISEWHWTELPGPKVGRQSCLEPKAPSNTCTAAVWHANDLSLFLRL